MASGFNAEPFKHADHCCVCGKHRALVRSAPGRVTPPTPIRWRPLRQLSFRARGGGRRVRIQSEWDARSGPPWTTERMTIRPVRDTLTHMAFELSSGLFAIAGTVVGSVGTFSVGWLTTRTQRQQAKDARRHSILDRQYTEHSAYMNRLDRLKRTVAALYEADTGHRSDAELNQCHADYIDAWSAYDDGRGGPQLAGPVELKPMLIALHAAAADYATAADALWVAIQRNTIRDDELADVRRTQDRFRELRTEYVDRAVELLSPTN